MDIRKLLDKILLLLVLIIISFGFVTFSEHTEKNNKNLISFFSNKLKDANISEAVYIRGEKYTITNGVTSKEKLGALKIAYALTMAKRSPILGISGTNPDDLKQAIGKLKDVQYKLSMAQNNKIDANMIASSLYPINFLYSIAELEKNRLKFISSGSDIDYRNYGNQLGKTLIVAKKDIKNFQKAFQKKSLEKPQRFPGAGGSITTAKMMEAVSLIQKRIVQVEKNLERRQSCLSGKIKFCDKSDIEISNIPEIMIKNETYTSGNVPKLVEEIKSIYEKSSGYKMDNSLPIVSLDSSVCLDLLPKPYYFQIRTISENNEKTFRPKFIGDILFYPTKNVTAQTLGYMNEKLGISFSLINPLAFYMCPEVGSDMGKIYAMIETLYFSNKYPLFLENERKQLTKNRLVLNEKDIINYIKSATQELKYRQNIVSESMERDLNNLILMFNEKSAGIEYLIESIAGTNDIDLNLKKSGIPFDISAENLFITHSAFPSLFLSQNPSAGSIDVNIRLQKEDDRKLFFSNVELYPQLKIKVGTQKVISDLREFFKMEGIIPLLKEDSGQKNSSEEKCFSVFKIECFKKNAHNFWENTNLKKPYIMMR